MRFSTHVPWFPFNRTELFPGVPSQTRLFRWLLHLALAGTRVFSYQKGNKPLWGNLNEVVRICVLNILGRNPSTSKHVADRFPQEETTLLDTLAFRLWLQEARGLVACLLLSPGEAAAARSRGTRVAGQLTLPVSASSPPGLPTLPSLSTAAREGGTERAQWALLSYLSSPVHPVLGSLWVAHGPAQPLVLVRRELVWGLQHAVPGKERSSPGSSA